MNFETPNNSVENKESVEKRVEAIAIELAEKVVEEVGDKANSIHQAAEELKQSA